MAKISQLPRLINPTGDELVPVLDANDETVAIPIGGLIDGAVSPVVDRLDASLIIFEPDEAQILSGYFAATAVGAAPLFEAGLAFQAKALACAPGQRVMVRNCVTSAALRPVLFYDEADTLIYGIDPGTTDEVDRDGTIYPAPAGTARVRANSLVARASGAAIGELVVAIERDANMQRMRDDASRAVDNLAGLIDAADVVIARGKYAQAYSNGTPDSRPNQCIQVPVTPGETIYFTGTAVRGSGEFCFAQLLDGTGQFVGKVRQSAEGEANLFYSAERLPIAGNVRYVRFTVPLDSPWRVRRFGGKMSLAAEADADRNAVDRHTCSLTDFSASPAPIFGRYVRAYNNDGLQANADAKYVPQQAVRPGQRIRCTGMVPASEYALAVWLRDGVQVGCALQGGDGLAEPLSYWRKQLIVPAGVNGVWGSGSGAARLMIEVEEVAPTLGTIARLLLGSALAWVGRSIAWIGTSIPATPNAAFGIPLAAQFDVDQVPAATGSYPQMIGERLGCTVYNEAIGASPVRFGHAANRTAEDPHGISGLDWHNVMYALAATVAEKDDLIANWATVRTKLTGGMQVGETFVPVAQMMLDDNPATRMNAPAGTDFIRSSSYEIRIGRHLAPNAAVDLIVIDHGPNDLHVPLGDQTTDIDTAGIGTRDRGTLIGGINAIMDYIRSKNPRQHVAFAEHYEDQRDPKIAVVQAYLAKLWSVPLLPLATKLGWGQQLLTMDGVVMTRLEVACRDKLHPHTDETGASTAQIADQHVANLLTLG